MINSLKKNIPNMLTCSNLISGCIAVYFAFGARFKEAFLFIIIGAIFDFFDGMVARLLHVSSPIGKELDSLADVITFGVAPATMIFTELTALTTSCFATASCGTFCLKVQPILPFVAFILAAFSALRLAKFNLDERQTTSFIGLPTPANALFWSSLLVAQSTTIETFSFARQLIIALLFITSYLLVCELPMFALKFKTYAFAENKLKYGFVAFSIIVFALTGIINGFWIVIACYVALSAIVALIERNKA